MGLNLTTIETEIGSLEPIVTEVGDAIDPAQAPTIALAEGTITALEALLAPLYAKRTAVDPATWTAQVAAGKAADAAVATAEQLAPQ